MLGIGKLIRHGIGALVGSLLGAVVFALAARGIMIDEGQVQTFGALIAEGISGVVLLLLPTFFSTLLGYAGVEKWLKRFKALDKEGWIDRLWLKHEAASPSADTKVLQARDY